MSVTTHSIVPIALVGLALYGEDAEILRGIHRYSCMVGNWIVETASHDVRDFEYGNLYRSPMGLIGHIGDPELAKRIRRRNLPVVNISGVMPDQLPYTHVGVEQERIGEVAAEHLLQLGLRHFVLPFAPGLIPYDFLNRRMNGFLQTLAAKDQTSIFCLPGILELPDGSVKNRAGSGGLEIRPLEDLPKPCGIFSLTDRMGLSINEECLSRGIRVPEEVSLVGAGNLEILCEFSHPALSSIEPPMEAVGFEAARTLHLLMQGHTPKKNNRLRGPMRLITRASSSQVMVEDPLVRQALTFIRDHVRKGINATDVARHCPGTRRNLEIRFKHVTGESILDRIHRVRMSHARELIETTDETLSRIADACGYSRMEHMSRAFKRYLGLSPRELRYQGDRIETYD